MVDDERGADSGHREAIEERVLQILEGPELAMDAHLAALCAEFPTDAAWILRMAAAGTEAPVAAERDFVLEHLVPKGTDDPAARHRFEELGQLATGGMGVIDRLRDRALRRTIVRKTMRASPEHGVPGLHSRLGMRFLEEAQVTGQLDHPNVVPVHDLGIDARGRIFFTMREVRGRTLKEVLPLVGARTENWSLIRVLEVFLKVCDALAYAHSKGVLHRDIKPTNVMVGSFGEVYVMDWGVAHVIGDQDRHGPRSEATSVSAMVTTTRRETSEQTPDWPILTLAGEVVGTPCYMPPEQALGQVARLGPACDVYAVGAMLYELLAGHAPYLATGSGPAPRDVLRAVMSGPPAPLLTRAPQVPAELLAICEKAMAREPALRYPTTRELAEDLRAFLEHRVVQAYRTGAFVELRKWIERNQAFAASVGAAVLVLVAGLLISLALYRTAEAARNDANANAEQARRNLRELLDLSVIQKVDELRRRGDRELWPADLAQVPSMRVWLEEARALEPELANLEHKLAELEAEALPRTASERLAGTWRFPADEQQSDQDRRWRHALLVNLIQRLADFLSTPAIAPGVLGIWNPTPADVERRLQLAESWHRQSLKDPAAQRAWDDAAAYVALPTPRGPYGCALHRLDGLVPLGVNPRTQLLEFWHVPSGEPPQPDPEWQGSEATTSGLHASRWLMTARTGIVLVLVPGGTFLMGAQRDRPDAHNYDPDAEPDEGPVHQVGLEPYLLSAFELTQAQWVRLAAGNPSGFQLQPGLRVGMTNPVERVSWQDCTEFLHRWGLSLPTEAQWERACRAESATPWWTGEAAESLQGSANIADSTYVHAMEPKVDWSDGFPCHAPVGSFRANRFGLHDTHGNVWEWCADDYVAYGNPPGARDGLRGAGHARLRVDRGGCAGLVPVSARTARRAGMAPDARGPFIGVRPSRSIGSS